MTPKILHGRSFKGAAAYLLHDVKDRTAKARVAWTMTRNLATQNPDTAWRVMAAIAMDSARLKKEAGIRNTGRKQTNVVKHLVLSWHPDEKSTLTREDMEAAIDGALAAISAQDRQALVIAHNDTKHPHVHILINRVLENGTLLPDAYEWKNLQEWALTYQRDRKQSYCPQRELNAEARARAESTKYRKAPRRVIELDAVIAASANDNPGRRQSLVQTHIQLARTLAARTHSLKDRHRSEWSALENAEVGKRGAIRRDARKAQAETKKNVVEAFKPKWKALKILETSEKETFTASEKSALGKLSNVFRNLDIGRSAIDGPRRPVLTQLWNGLRSSAEREAMFEQQQRKRRHALELSTKKSIRAALAPIVAKAREALSQAAQAYDKARNDLALIQNGERAHTRAEWNSLINKREQDFTALSASLTRTKDFNQTASPNGFLERMEDRARDLSQNSPGPSNDNERERDD
jgi:hypothetical protein